MSNPNYVTGQLIRRGDYNLFVTGTPGGSYNHSVANAGTVWGVGNGRFGYGQPTVYISPVETGNLIRSQEWDNLDNVLRSIISHQSGPGVYDGQPGTTFAAGSLITPISALEPRTQQSYDNVGLVAEVEESSPRVTTWSGNWGLIGPSITGKLQFIQSLTFTSADHARYFFNAGGKIKLRFARNGGPATRRNEYWSDLCDHAGTVEIGYRNTRKVPGTGNSDANKYFILGANQGGYWAQSTNVSVRHFEQHSYGVGFGRGYDGADNSYNVGYDYAGEYGYNTDGDHDMGYLYYETPSQGDYIRVNMQVVDSDGQHGNIGKTVRVITEFYNANYQNTPVDNQVTCGMSVSLVLVYPQRLYLENTWGTPDFNGVASEL